MRVGDDGCWITLAQRRRGLDLIVVLDWGQQKNMTRRVTRGHPYARNLSSIIDSERRDQLQTRVSRDQRVQVHNVTIFPDKRMHISLTDSRGTHNLPP
jgi:hypothetical protein